MYKNKLNKIKHNQKNNKNEGFTLVELSIVLVIVSLIIGVVITGDNMITATRITKTIKNFYHLETAYENFKKKYYALPGDISDATTLWPSSGAVNGDNDGLIENNYEFWNAIEHISFAGFMKKTYSYTSGDYIPGDHTPECGWDDCGYQFAYIDSGEAIWNQGYSEKSGNAIRLGGLNNSTLFSPVLKTHEAKMIDTKMDDGIAYSGKLFGGSGIKDGSIVTPNCTDVFWDNTSPNDYNLTLTGTVCSMLLFVD